MTVEFLGQMKPKPFKSIAQDERDRIEEIKLARLKAVGKLPPEPEPEITREPFYD